MEYHNLLHRLYNLSRFNSNKIGLQNIQNINNLLDNPLKNIPIIHIAGTNGKGSVSIKLASCCKLAGYKTGLFISPHISSFRERIQLNNYCIPEKDLIDHMTRIFHLCEKYQISATFFEITTATAFLYFNQMKCDIVVLECGLGGRLDSTNVVNPILSIITSIQYDHMGILGSTLEEIAMEKAGIMKPGVDVIIGPDCPRDVLQNHAARVGSPFHHVPMKAEYEREWQSTNSAVSYDTEAINQDIAKSALNLLRQKKNQIPVLEKLCLSHVDAGLQASLPCRFEHFVCDVQFSQTSKHVPIILDMAHNEGGMQSLVWKLYHYYPGKKFRFILGISARPDIMNCLRPLFLLVTSAEIHCIEARNSRALASKELQKLLLECEDNWISRESTASSASSYIPNKTAIDEKPCSFQAEELTSVPTSYECIRNILAHVLKLASEKEEIVVVCGTAFIMSDVRYLLGIVEPRDEI